MIVRELSVRMLCFAALTAVALAVGPASARAQELGPLIAGRSAYVDGTFVWTDYAYDDHGANTNGRPGGDGMGGYPAGLENHADLIQLQIGLAAGQIAIRAILETLVDAGRPVLGVAFDSDANPTTGATSLPGGSWTPASPLGVDRLVIARGSSARLYQYSGAWVLAGEFPASVDTAANTISTTVPASLASPGAATWRAFGVLGFADPLLGTSWPEGGVILDLAFVDERPYLHQSALQGDVLAGLADPDAAAAAVDFARVAAADTELPEPRLGRFETFLYHSALDLPEGIGAAGGVISGQIYLGPYQPYLVWVPDPLPAPAPLLVFLHGASQNHLQDTWVNATGWPYHGLTPGLVAGYAGNNKPVGADPGDVYLPNDGAIGSIVHIERSFVPYAAPGLVLFPLGRSNSSGYAGIHEEDVLEAIEDLSSRFSVDADRVSLSGASMGGIGTFRLAALHPDLWSHAAPLLGSGADVSELYENLYNVPVRMHNGLLDPLVSQPAPTQTADAIDALGYDYRYYLFATREHESLFPINHCLRAEALAALRDTNPARVVFSVRPEFADEQPDIGYEHRYDRAYWVSEIAVRSGSDEGNVTATSHARPGRVRSATAILAARQNISEGRDECGPNPSVQTLDVWTERGIALAPAEPAPLLEQRVATALTAIDAVALDLVRAGIVPAGGSPGDWDGDGVGDAVDNCRYWPNPGQGDAGGFAGAGPDGIGDACQCGDVSDNGRVNGQDAHAVTRHGLGVTPNAAFRVLEKCDVTGNGLCNGQDAGAIRAALIGAPSAYHATACPAFTGERFVDVSTDGPSQVTLSGLVPGTLGRLDAAPAGAAGSDGRLTIAVPTGQHRIGIRP